MERAIITGATGAVGTALVKELVLNGIEVLVLVHPNSQRKENILRHPLVSLLEIGMDGYNSIDNQTGKKYDVFYHLAWAGTTGQARNDMHLQNKNVCYALDAVGMAKRFGCRRFIGAGSQAEYGRAEGVLKPDTPAFPETGYGMAKLCAGQMAREYAHQLGLEHIWVRILSVYGPNDSSQSMIMSTIRKLQAGEVPQFTKGEQMWDYLYSGDAARAFYLLGEKGKDSRVYVLGSGNARPLKEYIEELRDIVLPEGRLGIGDISDVENKVVNLCADVSKLKQDIGWKSMVSFKEGISKTADYIQEENYMIRKKLRGGDIANCKNADCYILFISHIFRNCGI